MESWQLFVTSLGKNISGWTPKARLIAFLISCPHPTDTLESTQEHYSVRNRSWLDERLKSFAISYKLSGVNFPIISVLQPLLTGPGTASKLREKSILRNSEETLNG